MATIQRTFKDPTLQNPLKYLGYDSIPVEIEDSGTSENYFNVQGIGQELHAGKNLFYIKPDPETLVDNAEIGVEVLDADGDLLPVRLLDNRRSDGSIGLVIEVDENRPKGYGQISIVSVARGKVVGARLVAVRNPGLFNIRWAKRLYINRDANNTSEITFIKAPQIEVSELKLPYYEHHFNTKLTSSLSQALTSANPVIENEITCSIYQLSSSYNTNAKISYEKRGEQIYLELSSSDFGGFVSDMENGTLFFDAKDIVGIEPSATTINAQVEDGDSFATPENQTNTEGSYFTSILQVLSPSRILVSSPHTTFQGSGNTTVITEVMHQQFQHSDFTLTWAMPPYSHSRYPHPDPPESESMFKTSYAGIVAHDLDPYSGEVHRIKTYIRAESRPDDYELCSDLPIEAQEMLVVSMSPHYNKNRFKNIPCGRFDRLNSSVDSSDVRYFGNYWTTTASPGIEPPTLAIVSESLAFPTVEQPPNEVLDFIPMRPSLRVGTLGEVSPLDDNVGRDPSVQPLKVVELKSNVSASFKKDKVYVLEVSAFVKSREITSLEKNHLGVAHGIGTFVVENPTNKKGQVKIGQAPGFQVQPPKYGGIISGQTVSSQNVYTIPGGPVLTAPRLDIFGFGDAFQDDTNRLGLGKLIGEVNDVNQPKGRIVDVKKVEGYSGVDHVLEVNFRFPFKADANAIGEFRFEIERGLWYFQEISVKPYERAGVSSHNYNYLVPLPRGLSHPDRRDVFDFMFEFYNIEGHMCAEKVYIDNICMDNEWTIAPTSIVVENIDNVDNNIEINGPLVVNNLTNITSSTSNVDITNNFGDILVYNTGSGEIGHVQLGCALDYMDSENCCCHLHADTNIYIFIDNTSMAVVNSNPDGGSGATYTPSLLTRWVITKFEKDMRERYPFWKGSIFVGQGSAGPGPGTLPAERWLSMMSWPAVGNQRIDNDGIGQGITGSMSSVTWGEFPAGTTQTDESIGAYVSSDNFHAFGYSASAYYLENAPIIKDGVPDTNVIVFTMVDETDPTTNPNYGGAGNGYHYRHNDSSFSSGGTNLTGTSADFNNHLTSHYKADYGLFVGKAHPLYTCFAGYVYALPSSNSTTHPVRQHFALHIYAAIEQGIVDSDDFISDTPTGGNLSAITGSNPYANAANSVGNNSPWYQGGIYGLSSQSIQEKHNFVGGISGWYSQSLGFPVSLTNANKSGSWLRGQASFSADLFEFINGDSIGVKVDGTTICVNEANELFARHTGSYTGSFTGDIITNNITINDGGINTYIIGDTFIIRGGTVNIFGGDTHVNNLTVNNLSVTNISNIDNTTTSITNEFNNILVYNTSSQDLAELKIGCALGFMDSENCCCHLHANTNIYIFIDNTSLVFSGSAGDSAALLTRYVVPKFEKDMRERYSYWKGNIYVGEGSTGPVSGTNMSERWLSWMSWPAVGNQNELSAGSGITGSLVSVKWDASGSATDFEDGTFVSSDNYHAYGYSSSAYYLENSPISASSTVDENVIVFTIVDETETDYHNKVIPQGTDSDWSGQPTDNYKRDYGLFVGEAYPQYDCFSGYVYALPRSTGISAGARQKFALHVYGAIETGIVDPANFVSFTPTGANLSAITGSNPYANAANSVGTLSPHYQGGIYGLKSQSIKEKHDFAQGAATWHAKNGNVHPHYELNSTSSWESGQQAFSSDLFDFIDGDSIGVRVDAKTICVNDANELFAKTGSMVVSQSISSVTASFALTASHAVSASHEITFERSSSHAQTADVALSGTGSFTGSFTGVSNTTGSFTGSGHITSASFALTASHVIGGGSGDGDDLGNHTATQDLDLNGNDIIGVTNLTASGIISASGFVGDLVGTASYGADNDWYKQGASDALTDPQITDQIYHNGLVGIGDFSSDSVTHNLQVEGKTRIGNSTDDRHEFTGSIHLSHSAMSIFTGSGKFAFGLEHSNAQFAQANTRLAQFYSGSDRGVFLNVTNWETASAFTAAGGSPGDSGPSSTNGPRSGISVNGVNSRANYGIGGSKGVAGGSFSFLPDTFEGNTNGNDVGDGGDVDSLGRRLLQEVLHITTGGNPQPSINIHARGDRGQQIRFFTGNDDARNTGGKTVETQRMTIINEGLIGIGTHDPQRRLHISESGNTYNGQKVPLRVNNFTEGPAQNVLVWDENTGDVYKKPLSELPSGDGGINTFIIGDTFVIGPHNTFINNVSIFSPSTFITNLTASNGQFTGSFTGSFTGDGSGLTGVTGEWDGTLNGDAQITGSLVLTSNFTASSNVSVSGDIEVRNVTASGQISASGGFIGDLTGTASYGADNDWYKQGVSDALTDPTITDQIYHNGRVGIGDFSSDSVSHILQVEGASRIGNSTDDRHIITGSIQLSHSAANVFTGSGKFQFGIDHSVTQFSARTHQIASFISGSQRATILEVVNWETQSAYIAQGGTVGGNNVQTNGPRALIQVTARNSSASYGLGGTRGTTAGIFAMHPDTYEGNTSGDDVGDGGDVDSQGNRLLQEVLNISTGGNPQGSINIHARGDRGQEIRFFTGNDDARNTGGRTVETQRMTIHHDGGVGIGTHNPQRRLHVSKSLNENVSTPIVRFEDLPSYPSTVPVNMVVVDTVGDLYQMDSDTPLGTVNQFNITNITSSNIFVTNITASNVSASNFTGSFTGSFTGDGSGLTGINATGGSGNYTGSFTGSFTGISNTTGSFSGSGFIASASQAACATQIKTVASNDDASYFPLLGTTQGDENACTTVVSDPGLTYNPSTNTFSSVNIGGTATNATNVVVSNDTGDLYHPLVFIDDTSPDGSVEALKANANITVNPADASLTLAQITASNNISASGYVYSNQIALNPDTATQAAIQTGILNGDYSLFVGSGSSNTTALIYSDTGHSSLQLRSNTGANAQLIFNEDGSARYILGHKGSDDSFQIRNSSFMTGGDELFNLAFDGSGLKLGHDANFHVTASGNISTSADIYFSEAYGASAVYHDNDANTGIEFSSDTIEIKENGQQSAKFATTGGNSIGNSLYMTAITGSSITLGKSSAEHVTSSADLWFQTDDSKILFGADKDIKLSHTADRGLTISNIGGNLGAGSAESASSLLGLTLHNDTTTIAAGDYIGGLFYTADSNDVYQEQTYVSLVAQVQSTAETRESANLYINVVHDGFDGGDAANQPAVSIKGGQNQIINHLGTKHEQLTTLSSSNNLPLILSKLKSIPTYTDFLTYDSGSGYVYKQGRDNVSFGSNTGGVGTYTIGVTFMIGPIVNITNNTLITNNFTTTGTGNLSGDVTIGTNCDNFLLINSKVTASCIISSSDDVIARDVDFRNITGSGNIQVESTAPENYFFGAINVRHNDRHIQSNINATPMGDDVSIFEGSLIVGERGNVNGIPNNAIINGAESLIVGQGNAVTNMNARSIVMGYFNSGSGLANFVGGSDGNKGLSDVTMVFGYGNRSEDNDGGIVLGSHNDVSTTGTNGHHAIGTYLVNSGSNGGNKNNAGSIALGRYNKHGVVDAFFTIGDGRSDSQRRDLLVARSGSIEIFGNITGSGGANPTNISIDGTLEAAVKSFVIPHPTRPGNKLKYGVLEGPEHAVYYRGKTTTNTIELPEEWVGLVDEDTITVQLTPIGTSQTLYVSEIKDNKIFIKNGNVFSSKIQAFYLVHGTRKDVDPLETIV